MCRIWLERERRSCAAMRFRSECSWGVSFTDVTCITERVLEVALPIDFMYCNPVVRRKSSTSSQHFRPGTSRNATSLARFAEQMADFARAERFLQLREGTHLSRERVAQEIGVTTRTVYAWETGGKIKWENAIKAAAFYGVDAESLVSRDVPEGVGVPEETQLDRIEDMLERITQALELDKASAGARRPLADPPPLPRPKKQSGGASPQRRTPNRERQRKSS